MIGIIILFVFLGAVFLYFFLRNRVQRADAMSLIFKTLTSVCFLALSFAAVARQAAASSEHLGYAILITAGLFFGLLGDIALELKYNCPEQSDCYTYAGFIAFAIGHVFFLIALIKYYRSGAGVLAIILPIVVAIVAGIAIGMGGKLLSLDYGKFKGITMFYGALLISSALVSLALSITGRLKNPATILFFIGAILFLISDLILSGTYFGEGKNRPVDIVSNHIFYYAAQFLIAISAFM